MKNILTEQESKVLVDVGFKLSFPCKQFTLSDLLDELDVMLDGYHYELVRYYDGWEVSGDMALTYKRCPDLINAIAGTLYLWKKQKNEEGRV
jgi:hypothetical protein